MSWADVVALLSSELAQDDIAGGGVTSGPTVDAIAAANGGIPGTGTTEAVARAVKLAVLRTRELGFVGRAPTLHREMPDGTMHLVNYQR